MAIVLELQAEALKSDIDILSLLRKAYLVAKKLGLKDFESWIYKEMNGYSNTDLIPEYRKIKGSLKGLNPYTGWIPTLINDSELENLLTLRDIFDSIPSLNSLLKQGSKELSIPLNGNACHIISKFFKFETEYILSISPNCVENIIERVKNEILDWSLILEENNILGENLQFTYEEKEKAHTVPQITNYVSNFYGDVSDSKIQQGANHSLQN